MLRHVKAILVEDGAADRGEPSRAAGGCSAAPLHGGAAWTRRGL